MAQTSTAGITTPTDYRDPFDKQSVIVNSKVINIGGDVRSNWREPADPTPIVPDQFANDTFGGFRAPADPLAVPEYASDDVESLSDTMDRINSENAAAYRKEKLALAGASFASDIMKANSAYSGVRANSLYNINMAHIQAADARARASQQAFKATSDANVLADQTALSLMAQGQSLSGEGVANVRGSIEAAGHYNAMIEEINGVREALGYELEAAQYQAELDQARINRNESYLSSALNFGVGAYLYS